MSDERKIEYKKVIYLVNQKKQPYAIEMKRKLHHMVTKLYPVNDRWLLAPF